MISYEENPGFKGSFDCNNTLTLIFITHSIFIFISTPQRKKNAQSPICFHIHEELHLHAWVDTPESCRNKSSCLIAELTFHQANIMCTMSWRKNLQLVKDSTLNLWRIFTHCLEFIPCVFQGGVVWTRIFYIFKMCRYSNYSSAKNQAREPGAYLKQRGRGKGKGFDPPVRSSVPLEPPLNKWTATLYKCL